MISSRGHIHWSRHLSAITACIVLPAVALGVPACAASDEEELSPPDGRVVLPSADGGDEGSTDAGAEDASAVPCAVGNLCRAPVPFYPGWVSALAGRSKTDVWASSLSLLMHYDGTQWTKLDSDIDETFSSLVLTENETWGGAGELVMRRGLDAASVRTVRVPGSAPSAFGLLPGGVVYLPIWPYLQGGGVLRLEFDTNTITRLPNPAAPWQAPGQSSTFRASFWSPVTGLWFVGDNGAVARYPISDTKDTNDASDGGSRSPVGPGALVYVPSYADLRAVWGHGDQIFAAGYKGTILQYDGTEWRAHETGTTAALNAIFGLSPTDIWAAGDDGTVLHFDGTAWARVGLGTDDGSLTSIWGSGPDDVWIGGEDGLFHWGPLP